MWGAYDIDLFLIKAFCKFDCQLCQNNSIVLEFQLKNHSNKNMSSQCLIESFWTIICLVFAISCNQYEHWRENFRYPLKMSLSLMQCDEILIFRACLSGGTWRILQKLQNIWSSSKKIILSLWGTDFIICVAAAVWVHAVVSDHFSCERTQTQSATSPCANTTSARPKHTPSVA